MTTRVPTSLPQRREDNTYPLGDILPCVHHRTRVLEGPSNAAFKNRVSPRIGPKLDAAVSAGCITENQAKRIENSVDIPSDKPFTTGLYAQLVDAVNKEFQAADREVETHIDQMADRVNQTGLFQFGSQDEPVNCTGIRDDLKRGTVVVHITPQLGVRSLPRLAQEYNKNATLLLDEAVKRGCVSEEDAEYLKGVIDEVTDSFEVEYVNGKKMTNGPRDRTIRELLGQIDGRL